MGVASGVSDSVKLALNRAKVAWHREPFTGEKYVYFVALVRDRYGIQLYQQMDVGYTGYDIVDEEKFAWFLLKYSS